MLNLVRHLSAASPSASESRPCEDSTASTPSRAVTFAMCLKRMETRTSGPLNCSVSASRRAFPFAVFSPNRAVHTISAPIRESQHHSPFRRRHSLDGIPDGGARNGRAVPTQISFEPHWIGLARLAQEPAHGFPNQIFAVAMKRFGDLVRDIQCATLTDRRD